MAKTDLEITIGAGTKELTAGLNQAQVKLKQFENQADATMSRTGKAVGKSTRDFTNFNRVIQDAPFGLMGVANNLQMLIPNIGLLSVGINLALTAVQFAQMGFGAWTRGLVDNKKAVDDSKTSGEDYIKTLNSVAQARVMGNQSAAAETTTLSLLYKQYTDNKLALTERKSAYDQLQKLYPSYFGNIKFESEASDKTKAAYDRLTTSIIATARARAAGDLITKNSQRILENEQKLIDLGIAGNKARTQADKATANAKGASGELGEAKALADFNAALKGQDAIQKQIRDTVTDTLKLREKNLTLETSITDQIKQGAVLSGGIGGDPIRTPKAVKNTRDEEFKGGALQDVSGRVAVGLMGIVDQYTKTQALLNTIPLVPPPELVQTGLGYINTELTNFSNSANEIINGGIAGAFAGIGEAIGNSLATGANVADAVGGVLLSTLGSVLGQVGQLAIATGITMEAIKQAFKNPYTAVAAGVALIALSGYVKAKSNSLLGGGGSGGSGGVSGGGGGMPRSSNFSPGSGINNLNGSRVVFEISGQKLIGVMTNVQNANRRIGP